MSFGSLAVGDVRRCLSFVCRCLMSVVCSWCFLLRVVSRCLLFVGFVGAFVMFCCWRRVGDCVMLFGMYVLLAAIV